MAVPYKRVEVEWVDSHTDNDWQTVDDVKRISGELHALTVFSSGYLVVDQPGHIVLAGNYAPMRLEKALVGCTTQIPRCAIVGEIRELSSE